MKKIAFCAIVMLMLGISNYSFSFTQDCTSCGSGEQECTRVIVGNEVHIFYGKASPCNP